MAHRTLVEDYLNGERKAGNYSRLPDISCRDKWESIDPEFKAELIRAGEKALKEPWPQLLVSDFTEFGKSGNRVQFEDKYFPRRRKLNNLIIAECVENKGRFMDAILDGFYLILEETTWCLPAHNTYVRDMPQEYLPDISRPVIDLFDAESGALVAIGEYLLRPVFEKISPYICKYVNERLETRIFKPYFDMHFWWMGNGKEPMCNWTVWCTQNVLICALTRPEGYFDNEKKLSFLKKAALSTDYFLDDYGEDGCCSEGAQYYSHAGLCLFGVLELMDASLKSDNFKKIYSDKLIKNVAEYIVKMHVADDNYVNFADCSRVCGRRTAREYLFGKAVGSRAMMNLACSDLNASSKEAWTLPDEINLFYHLLQVFNYNEMKDAKREDVLQSDSFFASTGLMIARDSVYTLAVKAGCNADSHNHNDVGSFTIYKSGKPLVIDLGVGTYTRETFSDRRYEIWTMQSQFHNVPTFLEKGYDKELGRDSKEDFYDQNVIMQHDGADYKAVSVSCNIKDGEDSSLSMDIAPAYGDSIKSYKRTITLHKEKGIEVEDIYSGGKRSILSIMTLEKPDIIVHNDESHNRDVMRIAVGNLGQIQIKGAQEAKAQVYPINDARLKLAWEHEVYRVLLTMDNTNIVNMQIS